MPHKILNHPVTSLNVGELVELIRQTIRDEFTDLLVTTPQDELTPTPPPIRDIDTIISKMQATGKYNKKFLVSLRKGMQRSQTFGTKQRAKT